MRKSFVRELQRKPWKRKRPFEGVTVGSVRALSIEIRDDDSVYFLTARFSRRKSVGSR